MKAKQRCVILICEELMVSHVDEFVDQLLTEDRVCDVILPRLMPRRTLEDLGQLEPRVSPLEEFLRYAFFIMVLFFSHNLFFFLSYTFNTSSLIFEGILISSYF